MENNYNKKCIVIGSGFGGMAAALILKAKNFKPRTNNL